MERRNFFKSLFAAGMVIAAPKILDVNPVEAAPVEKAIVKPKLAGVDAVFKSSKHKGTIFYDGKVIANFNDVEINTHRNMIDTSTLYDDNGYFNPKISYTPGNQETTIKAHVINVDYELSQTAFFNDSIVELLIQVDDMKITANGYLESMSISNEFEEHSYSEWDIRVSGTPTATINHGG